MRSWLVSSSTGSEEMEMLIWKQHERSSKSC